MSVNQGFQLERGLKYLSLNSYPGVVLTIWRARLCPARLCAQAPTDLKTHHIAFEMTNGLRWQEGFRAADEPLMNKNNGVLPANPGSRKPTGETHLMYAA